MDKSIDLRDAWQEGISLGIEVLTGDFEGVYSSSFVGFDRENLILSRPALRGEAIPIKAGDELRVTFMRRHIFYTFVSPVTEVPNEETLLLGYPGEIIEIGKRRNVRVGLDFPLEVRAENGVPYRGRVMDISLKGLSFSAPCKFVEDKGLHLSLSLPRTSGGTIKLAANAEIISRKIIYTDDQGLCRVSVKFIGLLPEYERAILDYITNQLETSKSGSFQSRTSDLATQKAMVLAQEENIYTVWDRFDRMQPMCGFGELGICCRNCVQGPCRIDPFGEGAKEGVCGVTADVMVARNTVRMIAGGTAAHAEHARHLAHALVDESSGYYGVKDKNKLRKVASGLKFNKRLNASKSVGKLALDGLSSHEYRENPWVWGIPDRRKNILRDLGVMPAAVDTMVTEMMQRTTMGVDANTENLLMGGLKCSLADYTALKISTDIADILFGTPSPSVSKAGLGVLLKDAVNVAVHGHNPMVAEAICDAAEEMHTEAVRSGASKGINVVGICCTGNEVLMRRGIPLAANYLSQELAITTGALDAVVVDYQCVMPGIGTVADCFQTRVFTTMENAKLEPKESVKHMPFKPENARETAMSILREAIYAYKKRKWVEIPQGTNVVMAGFSAEAIIGALSAISPKDPLKPLIDNIVEGNIYGVALLCGCNNVNVQQDKNITGLAAELIKNNVLLLATGCAAGALAKAGFMDPEAGPKLAGKKLSSVLAAIGQAAGVSALPPVLHMGSCVDNSRAVELAAALAEKLGVDISSLPLVATAPELMSEKSIAIGMAAVALGIPVHLGIIPPIQGSERVVEILTSKIKGLTGGYFIAEPNPFLASEKLIDVIEERRSALKLKLA